MFYLKLIIFEEIIQSFFSFKIFQNETGDIDQITNALNDFVTNKATWDKKAEIAKNAIMKNFTSEIMAKNYLNHFIQNLS